jgi:hypothetical protein
VHHRGAPATALLVKLFDSLVFDTVTFDEDQPDDHELMLDAIRRETATWVPTPWSLTRISGTPRR